jgi:hypothetical protein
MRLYLINNIQNILERRYVTPGTTIMNEIRLAL